MQLRFAQPLLLGFGVIALSGCSLISTDIEADVTVNGEVMGMETQVYDHFVQDLLEIDDYKNNLDKIKKGKVTAFNIRFTKVHEDNAARTVGGRVNVRLADTNDPWIEGVAQWTPVYLVDPSLPECARDATLCQPVEVMVEPEPATARQLNDILFSDDPKPVEFQLEGFASDAPVHFDYEVTVFIDIEAGA